MLLEAEDADQERDEEQFMTVPGSQMEEGHVADTVIFQSSQQADQLWEMRDDVEALVAAIFPIAAFDVSLPIREMEAYVSDVEAELAQRCPGARLVTFGHLGDGNIHGGVGAVEDRRAVESIVYGRLAQVNGSVSAEQGIGLEKKAWLRCSRSEVEIGLMKTLKTTLDPKNILNPGKVLPW